MNSFNGDGVSWEKRGRGRGARPVFLSVPLWVAAMAVVPAQGQVDMGGEINRVDRFGNVRSEYKRRDVIGTFPLSRALRTTTPGPQRPLVTTAQPSTILPMLPFAGRTTASVRRFTPPAASFARTPRAPIYMLRSLSRYGGFRSRGHRGLGDPVSSIARRTGLIGATALNAPVHRANLLYYSPAGLRGTQARMSVRSSDRPIRSDHPLASLGERLEVDRTASHQRLSADAWERFAEAKYRQAARMFETAAELTANDTESRTGELFCYVSLGATRTAVQMLRQILRRDSDPFALSIRMADRFKDELSADRLRVRARFQKDVAREQPTLVALAAFVLWHLDERQEALAAMEGLISRSDDSDYADWAVAMRRAVEPAGAAAVPP